MGTYLLRRALLMVPTLLGITLITFAIMRLAPGDPVAMSVGGDMASGEGASLTRGQQEVIRQRKIDLGLLGADGNPISIPVQYLNWVGRIARLDFGESFKDKEPVVGKIARALPITVMLSLTSILIAYLVAVPIGVFSAVRRNTIPDHAVSTLLFFLWSFPTFLAGTLLILTVGRADWLPFVGLHSPGSERLGYLPWVWDHGEHVVMPLACLTYASFAALSRFVRTGMLENLGLDYVRTARSKGLPERDVILRHALRNSLIPVITILANILPALIGGSVVVELIFTIDGMGYLGFQSILSRDYPVIMAIATFSAVLTMIGMLVSDVLYCVVDPRISLH